MRNLLISVAILFGIAPAVSAQEDAAPDLALSRFVRALAAVDIPEANVSVVSQPLEGNGKGWSLNPNALRLTASTAKLYTTYAALVRLGPATTLKTEVWKNGDDLIILGSGDPSLTVERLSSLLRQLRAQGVQNINGNIVLDRSRFGPASSLPFDPMTFDGKPMRLYNVGPDALLLNFRAIQVVLTPQNSAVQARLDTPLAGASIDNQLQLGDGPCSDWKDAVQSSISSNFRITLKGKFPRSCTPQTLQLAAHGAELVGEAGANKYAEALIRGLWQEMGGSWSGKAVSGSKPGSATLLASTESQPVAQLVRDINKYSNNVMARQLFLLLADAPATQAGAEQALRQTLSSRGVPMKHLVVENGSGLSRKEATTAEEMTGLLRVIWNDPRMPELLSSLPIGGTDGTLKKNKNNGGDVGRIRLKTGSLENTRAAAGYVQDSRGHWHTLAVLIQDPKATANYGALREAIDQLSNSLANQ
jgi:D-alanyl-D-alanine carboxypeptidase/D-alanyl-D-alanine-endopeptidase (penicillin-binding protein 4)